MPSSQLLTIVCWAFCLSVSPPVLAAELVVGANVYDEPFIPQPAQDAEIGQLAHNGVKTIRTGFSAKSVDYIIRAYRQGIGTIAIAYPTEGSNAKAIGRWSRVPLSQADPQAFAAWIKPLLDRLETAGVRLTAIELGNEINTSGFNGDIPLPGSGRVLSIDDLNNTKDSEGPVIAASFRQYLHVLVALKDIRNQSRVNKATPILVAGLGNWGTPSPKSWNGQVGVSITDTISFLRQNGADRLADAYAVHVYPSGDPHTLLATRVKQLEHNILAGCAAGGKPCWLTEWGMANGDQSCPLNDEKRKQAIAAERTAFEQFVSQGRLAAAIFFTWTGLPGKTEDAGGIFRCGVLTDAGKLALSPM